MNRNNYVDDDDDDDYYRRRERSNQRDYGHSRRRRSRSRSRSREKYRDNNEDSSWSSSNRDRHHYERRNHERNDRSRDRRSDYDKKENYKSGYRHYESDDNSDSGGNNNFSTEPNNKVIVRGLAQHITEADIQCDLIQCGLKPISIRLIRKKSTGASRGFAFVTFSSIDDAKSWIEKKQGVLILQDQYRAILQYSFTKDMDGQYDKIQTDWYCGKCGVFNFKRRDNCFKCSASREESGSEGFDEISSILTKKIMLRNLDALTTEEKVLIVLQDKIPDVVAKISKILICRDQLTQISRGICYLNFDNLVDSMNTFQALEKLSSFEIDSREVTFSYCVDSENRLITKSQSNNGNGSNRRDNNSQMSDTQSYQSQSNYQYTLADVPKLAEQATNMYAHNPAEKESYMKYYTEFYTNQISTQESLANSGASIAQSAIERKQKMKAESLAQIETPNGTDGKKYPAPDISLMKYDTSGYLFDRTTNLYFDQATNYFYNSETGEYLYWDAQKSTYVLATHDSASTTTTSAHVSTVSAPKHQIQTNAPPPPPEEPKEKEYKRQKEPQDKVKVAKNIVKDMEKWAKKLNSKKDYMPVQHQVRPENSPSPLPSYIKTEAASDICFSMLEKKTERPITTTSVIAPAAVVAPTYNSDSDDHEDQAAFKSAAAANCFNENDLVDFDTLTCLLCKRAFQSADILNKHVKQSNLHRENLQKYKLQNGILELDPKNAQVYRDRAKERRLKYGEAEPWLPPVNKAKERFQREMEKKASLVQTYQSQSLASRPIDDTNKGNKLLKAMGWKEGSGLGKTNQGRTDIIEAEQRVSSAGLGAKNASFGAGPGDDYKSYIKKMMKKRYEEVN